MQFVEHPNQNIFGVLKFGFGIFCNLFGFWVLKFVYSELARMGLSRLGVMR